MGLTNIKHKRIINHIKIEVYKMWDRKTELDETPVHVEHPILKLKLSEVVVEKLFSTSQGFLRGYLENNTLEFDTYKVVLEKGYNIILEVDLKRFLPKEAPNLLTQPYH